MSFEAQLTLIIPAYNEADNLSILLPELIQYCRLNNRKLIIVNDGSKDNSKEILERNKESNEVLSVIHHKLNKGYGAAIKSGIRSCETEYCITLDADGQHKLEDIDKLFDCLKSNDADMVVGSRKGFKSASFARGIGKRIIRMIAKLLMPVPIYDLNSGLKIYRTELAKKYIHLAPDTMSYSDIITLIFISNRHLVLEQPISINPRLKGTSTIGMQTAFETIMEIINVVFLFNPAKLFLPLAVICMLIGLIDGIPILLAGHGLSTGSMLGIFAGIIFFLLGLIAEQLSNIRKSIAGDANK